ncbi:MAG: hypothetical protein AAF391_05320 [Bacteroidota bacterium]
MDHRQLEKIENYHSGRMTPEESAAFENELAANPDLKAESNLQADIISGLKNYRKAQLKARLDAVDLNPSWIEFVQQSTLMKSFGGVAVASLVGAGVFFYAEPKEDTTIGESIVIDSPSYEDPEFIWNLGLEEAEQDQPVVKEDTKLADLPKQIQKKTKEILEEQSTVVVVEEETATVQAFTPAFNAPSAENIKDEEAPQTSDLDKLPEENNEVASNEPIDVTTENTKNLKVQYKYYDGKLFLSGDFDRAPYEILEINSASGRRIYVKYLDKYYQVGTTDQLTDLPEVTDQGIIDELKLLRQNK